MFPLLPTSTLFPYTTLFRSCALIVSSSHAVEANHFRGHAAFVRLTFAGRCLVLHHANEVQEPGGGSRDWKFPGDRKSTRLNSSHSQISYAVFCLKKKKQNKY